MPDTDDLEPIFDLLRLLAAGLIESVSLARLHVVSQPYWWRAQVHHHCEALDLAVWVDQDQKEFTWTR